MWQNEQFIDKLVCFSQYKLTKNQMKFLYYLNVMLFKGEYKYLSYNKICKDTNMCHSSINRTINKLLSSGVISREKNEICYSYSFDSISRSVKINIGLNATMKKKTGYAKWEELFVAPEKKIKKNNLVHYSKWKTSSILNYIRYVFENHLSETVDDNNVISISRSRISSVKINNIQSLIYDASGECFHLMLKAYIDWFAVKYLRPLHLAGVNINLGILDNKKRVDKFVEVFQLKGKSISDIQYALRGYVEMPEVDEKVEDEIEEKTIVSKAVMDSEYEVGGMRRLISVYGIVLSFNYMKIYTDMSESDMFEECEFLLKELRKRRKSSLVSIMEKTCELSPYHNSMIALDWQIKYSNIIGDLMDKVKQPQLIGDKSGSTPYTFLIKEKSK